MKQIVEEVYAQIRSNLNKTALIKCQALDKISGGLLHFKMENQQITGSFKLRGVLSKFSALMNSGVRFDRVVAASTGNHALAVCHVANAYNISPVVFVPENVLRSKLSRIEALGVEVHVQGAQSGETEQIAIDYARENQIPLIHPYNDSDVINGQATLGLEITEQLGQMDQVFVPVGGGGLISGIASYLKTVIPTVKIIGVQPVNASEMADSVEKGTIVEASKLHTISDGTAGGLDPLTITYKYCKDFVDEFVLVEEAEIINSLRLMETHLKIMVEPAAALALAGILKRTTSISEKSCVAIVCGGNIDIEKYYELMNRT